MEEEEAENEDKRRKYLKFGSCNDSSGTLSNDDDRSISDVESGIGLKGREHIF